MPGGSDPVVRPSGSARLDSLLLPSATVTPVPLSERMPEVAVRPVPQPLRLAPDPTTTVWCADLLGPAAEVPAAEVPAAEVRAGEVTASIGASPPSVAAPTTPLRAVVPGPSFDSTGGAPTLFV